MNDDLQRFPPPPQDFMPVYASEQSTYCSHQRSNRKKSQRYKKAVKFQYFTIFSYLCRNPGKQRGYLCFRVFWCVCFVFKAILDFRFLMTKHLGVSTHLFVFLYSKLVNPFAIRLLRPLTSIFTQAAFYLTIPKSNLYKRNHPSPACLHSQETALLLSSVLLWSTGDKGGTEVTIQSVEKTARGRGVQDFWQSSTFRAFNYSTVLDYSTVGVHVSSPVTVACVLPLPIPWSSSPKASRT